MGLDTRTNGVNARGWQLVLSLHPDPEQGLFHAAVVSMIIDNSARKHTTAISAPANVYEFLFVSDIDHIRHCRPV